MASSNAPLNQRPTPGSILIIGAGVFGLSTTLSLLSSPTYAQTSITLLDPYLPSLTPTPTPPQPSQNPHAASIDSSRIIRPDYAHPAYARLASQAQERWRAGFGRRRCSGCEGGGEGKGGDVYRESGVLLTADEGGSVYVRKAAVNARALGYRVDDLESGEEVGRVLGTGGGGEMVGGSGYVNWGSGWADAGRAMEEVMGMVVERARERKGVVFQRGKARRLLVRTAGDDVKGKRKVTGAELEDGTQLLADLTILAAGAWSGALLDLRGRAEARGQVVAYVPISPSEKEALAKVPVLLNLSTGMFIIPPVYDPVARSWVTKVARHSYGYGNPTTVISPGGERITTSLPAAQFSPIPPEGEKACRDFLRSSVPWLGSRAFSSTRICWYTDTPTGDFLIDYHPQYEGLFLATGGSGHGFKFLPVLGDKILAAVEGRLEEELAGLWRWRESVEGFEGTEDGSRGRGGRMDLEVAWREGERSGRSKL